MTTREDKLKALNTELGNAIIARAKMQRKGDELGIRRINKRIDAIHQEVSDLS